MNDPHMGKKRIEPKKAYRAIGLKVRALRNKRGWTLEECEEHGDLSWQQIQKIESGRNFTLKTLINIASLFGVHPAELLRDL